MKHEPNDPKKAGQPASKKLLFGNASRYAAQAIHTRFESVQWFVWDAEVPHGEKPALIRQSESYGEAVSGLIDAPCQSFFEDTYICDDQGRPKGQCGNCGYHESEHESETTKASVNHALWVAVEHLATSGNPKQNWPQFIALIESTGEFNNSQIERWNDLYSKA